MTKETFINYLDTIGAIYDDASGDRYIDTVFVYDKKPYQRTKKTKEYVPYLRVSWHEEYTHLCTRWNNVCGFMTDDEIKRICKKYAEG